MLIQIKENEVINLKNADSFGIEKDGTGMLLNVKINNINEIYYLIFYQDIDFKEINYEEVRDYHMHNVFSWLIEDLIDTHKKIVLYKEWYHTYNKLLRNMIVRENESKSFICCIKNVKTK